MKEGLLIDGKAKLTAKGKASKDIDEARGLTQHLIDEKYIKEPPIEMLEKALEKPSLKFSSREEQ